MDALRRSGPSPNDAPSAVPTPAPQARTRAPGQPPRRAMFESLRIRDFRLLWTANLGANLAMQMQMTARGWLIYDMTKSEMALIWVTLSFMLPQVVFSLAGGVLADRLHKRTIMVAAQSMNVVATLAMGTIILAGQINFWWFIAFGVFNGTVLSFSMPARSSMIPEIVGQESLVNAMAMQSMVFNLSRILGPMIAGFVIWIFAARQQTSTFGVAIIYYVICALYVVAVACTARVRHKGAPLQRGPSSPLQDIAEGLRYMRDEKLILGLMMLGFVPMTFGFTASSLMPAFNHVVVRGGPAELGMLTGVMGAGALFASLLLARFGDIGYKGRTMFITGFVWAAALGLFSFSSHLAPALTFCAVMGLCGAVFGNLSGTTMQLAMRPEVRGRVMSIMMMTNGMMPLGVLPMSFIAEHYGIGLALGIAAALLAASLIGLQRWFPDLQRIDKGHGDNVYLGARNAPRSVASGESTNPAALSGAAGGEQ